MYLQRNRMALWCAGMLLLVSAVLPAVAGDLTPGQGVSFKQVDYTYPGATLLNSDTGQVFIDYAGLPSIGSPTGYINVLNPGNEWLVQNVPVDLTATYPGLGVMFDLGQSGSILSLPVNVQYTKDPLVSPMLGSVFNFAPAGNPLPPVVLNAQGRGAGGRTVPPVPPQKGALTFLLPGASILFQPGHGRSVEQDVNQCGPASVANSLSYLNTRYGVPLAHKHIPGIEGSPKDSMVGQLDVKMLRKKGKTVSDSNFIHGKLDYLGDNPGQKNLIVKHQGGIGIPAGNITKNGVTSTNEGKKPTAEWILKELAKGEDVELAVGWDKGGGHWVTLIGGGTIRGIPWAAFKHDGCQGNNAMGTTLLEGGYGFTFLKDTDGDGYPNFVNFDGNLGEIEFVVSESIPEPASLVLLLLGAASWFGRRRGA